MNCPEYGECRDPEWCQQGGWCQAAVGKLRYHAVASIAGELLQMDHIYAANIGNAYATAYQSAVLKLPPDSPLTAADISVLMWPDQGPE